MMETKEEKKNRNLWQIGSFLAILITWGLTFIIWSRTDWSTARKGQFGDVFGAANALFSGFALWGLIVTIRQQKRSIELQKKEIDDARDELGVQISAMEKQRFENTFFQMLSLHHQIVDNLNYADRTYDQFGLTVVRETLSERRKVFEIAVQDLLYELHEENEKYFNTRGNKKKKMKNSIVIKDLNDSYKALSLGYDKCYQKFQSNLSHYYRNLYHLFKAIHESKFLLEDDKRHYASIVRAQLSHDEQALLYYNAMVEGLGNPKFLFLVSRFDLMQNFGTHQLKRFGNHEQIFETLRSTVMEENYKTETPVKLTI